MTCDELDELLADFAAGELAVEVLAVFEQHRCGCGRCGRVVETFQLTMRVTRALPKAGPLPEALERRLRAAVAAAEADARP